MIYPNSFESKTGFDVVRKAIMELCPTESARTLCRQMMPMSDLDSVETRLRQTAEMLMIVSEGAGNTTPPPFDTAPDISSTLTAIAIPGSYASPVALAATSRALAIAASIADFFKHNGADTSDSPQSCYPYLVKIASTIADLKECRDSINRAIDPGGNVLDSASPELRQIRKSIRIAEGEIGTTIRRLIRKAAQDGYLDADTAPVLRDDRPVIPVAAMHRRRIPGIIHDASATGKTIFIEPAEIVEVNNRIRSLRGDEEREIIKILRAISDVLRGYIDQLTTLSGTLALFAFIHAKAEYAQSIDAHMPHIQGSPALDWIHACHPGLIHALARQGKSPVPLDISMNPDRRILVISGPNAGGKSVCIKTVATIQYMIQCGVLPPIHENSHVGIFSDILAAIGDDQSLDDDLSTYSSHLRDMNMMLKVGNSRSLFIVDEMGSGTEPRIGGALAQAILQAFNDKGMWGAVTTHYHNLKSIAEDTPGMENASMLYDRHLMQPLFRFSIGNPGSSFALEIARKAGLPSQIIESASEIAGSDYINLDKYLLDIARDKQYWQRKREQIKQKEKRIDDAVERYQEKAASLSRRQREIIDDARRQADEIISQSNAAVERTIREIRTAQAEKERTTAARQKLREEHQKLTSTEVNSPIPKIKSKREKRSAKASKPTASAELTAGSVVTLEGQQTPGRIVEISGNKATVVFGMMKTTVPLSRLKPSMAKIDSGIKQATSMVDTSRQRQLDFKQEIDVRGMRVDEAVQAVTYFIDDAIQFRASRVRILHGTGTGALQQYIRQYLAGVDGVLSAYDEDVRFGGAGITVVDLA